MLQMPLRRTRPISQPDLDATTHISLVPELWVEAHYIAQRSTPPPAVRFRWWQRGPRADAH